MRLWAAQEDFEVSQAIVPTRRNRVTEPTWTTLIPALQAAEKLNFDLFCNKGTTLVGPQMQQNKGWALAPAAFLLHNPQYFCVFPQPV